MANPLVYSVGVAVLLTTLILVAAQSPPPAPADPCNGVVREESHYDYCVKCVETRINKTTNCTFDETRTGPLCASSVGPAEGVTSLSRNVTECQENTQSTTTTTTSAPTTKPTDPTTTPASTTTTKATTTVPTVPTTTGTSTTTTTTQSPQTTTNGTSTTPTPSPSPTPTAAPRSSGGMSFASFFGGIVFTLCMSGLGYLIWRFYRARMDRNYHTLSTNLI